MDPAGKQLFFNVKKGSDSSILWKGTVKIACLKYDPTTNETMKCCRLLNLLEFVKVHMHLFSGMGIYYIYLFN